MIKNFRTTISAIAIGLVGAIAVADLPTCTYPDPVIILCRRYHEGQLIESVDITCRMFEAIQGAELGIGYFECDYLWCDTATTCSTDSSKYQRKNRNKRVYHTNNGTNCRTLFTVTDTTDTNDGCCFCQMPPVPSWNQGG